jgi:ubiquinone/menaquinone biosynthesis C-methylase UbiE
MEYILESKLKSEILTDNCKIADGITILLNDNYLNGDNEKYMKMYNWMSHGYDVVETILGKLKYGNAIKKLRDAIISKLEWKNGRKVLYVSIGTGKNLQFIPKSVNLKTLDIVGVDISMGMLKKCKKRFSKRLNLSLVNCCAEDLPFKDNEFDIVFHIGGINFFNDKKIAIKEMIRVAKPGTKILIADETSGYIEKQYKRNRLTKKFYEGKTFDLKELKSSIPEEVTEKKMELLWNDKFYCLTFRKV